MGICVQEGAKEGETFKYYVDYLCKEGHVPKKMQGRLDDVRTLGNEATHSMTASTPDDAQLIFRFLSHVLRAMYEWEEIASASPTS